MFLFFRILQKTPLHIACENGLDMIVKLLLDRGANVNVKNAVSEL